jgi:hypothetical protein
MKCVGLSRLNSKEYGVIILVMQRLHQDDLAGAVLDREPWEVLALPAIAIDDESYPYEDLFGERVFRRTSGEALHPERDSVEILLKIREPVRGQDPQVFLRRQRWRDRPRVHESARRRLGYTNGLKALKTGP